MKIPVFVSCPTDLSAGQDSARRLIIRELDRLEMEPRGLGRTDYPVDLPLREVLAIAKHCSGGVILGFQQFVADSGTLKPGTSEERRISKSLAFPTPWNQLEAGILFTLGIPLLVFRDESISGGVFDPGVTDVFIHRMPAGALPQKSRNALRQVFLKWQGKVRTHYYGEQLRHTGQ